MSPAVLPLPPRLARLILFALWAAAATAHAQTTWQGRLWDGRRVEVDPNTNRPMVYSREGTAVPLWDGVHRLGNGSTITVHSGVMVPNTGVVNLRHEPLPPNLSPDEADPALLCARVVRKACGLREECAGRVGCARAHQLMVMQAEEAQERRRSGTYRGFVLAPAQCRQALVEERLFPACERRSPAGVATACDRLATKVCGAQSECARREGCPQARQLVEMEYQERVSSGRLKGPVDTTAQCEKALRDTTFFRACAAP